MRIMKMIAKWQSYWFYRNSPCQCNWNCMKKSMENIDSDDRVWRLNNDHCFSVYCAILMDYSNRNNYEVCAVHFKAEKKNIVEKDGFSSCHERGTKKKFWVPMRNRTSIVRILPFIRLIFFPILYTKHDAIDIADPSSMQDACHIWTS